MSLAAWAYDKFNQGSRREHTIRHMAAGAASHYTNPVIIAGCGRIGRNVALGLTHSRTPFTVIELDPEHLSALKHLGIPYIYGDSSNAVILSQAGLTQAKSIVITCPDQLAIVNTIINALSLNPKIEIVAWVHRGKDIQILEELGVNELIFPEYEASREFLKKTLALAGKDQSEITEIIDTILRRNSYI